MPKPDQPELHSTGACALKESKSKKNAVTLEGFLSDLTLSEGQSICAHCFKGTNSTAALICESHGVYLWPGTSLKRTKNPCPGCAFDAGVNYKLSYGAFTLRLKTIFPNDLYSTDEASYHPTESIQINCVKHGGSTRRATQLLERQIACTPCHKEKTYSWEKVKIRLASLWGDQLSYAIKGKWLGNRSAIIATCQLHGATDDTLKRAFARNPCGICREASAKRHYTNFSEFLSRALDRHGNRYSYDPLTYSVQSSKIFIRCNVHHWFFQAGTKHLEGQGCPSCSKEMSSGERAVADALEKLQITYMREKTFSDLLTVSGGRPRYDFWLPEFSALIEFDGDGHSRPVRMFGISQEEAELAHARLIRNDHLKDSYAAAKDFPLLRLSTKSNLQETIRLFLVSLEKRTES